MKSVQLNDLIKWGGCPVKAGSIVVLSYSKHDYKFELIDNGFLRTIGRGQKLEFSNLHRATLHIIRGVNPERKTVSGWQRFKHNGIKLSTYKKEYQKTLNIPNYVKQTGYGAVSIPFSGTKITFEDTEYDEGKDILNDEGEVIGNCDSSFTPVEDKKPAAVEESDEDGMKPFCHPMYMDKNLKIRIADNAVFDADKPLEDALIGCYNENTCEIDDVGFVKLTTQEVKLLKETIHHLRRLQEEVNVLNRKIDDLNDMAVQII